MTSTATYANRRPVRWLAAVGCPRPGLLGTGAERSMPAADQSPSAKQLRLGGRMRVPR